MIPIPCVYMHKNTYICRNNTELTSRSTTHVASAAVVGVVATLLQRFPDYTPYQIREQLIRESTKDVINFHTRNGLNLPSKIAETTQNRFAYIRKCINSKAIIKFNMHALLRTYVNKSVA